MLASSPLKPSAPSASLLRFLRAQSDSVFFFTPNPTTSCTRISSESPWQHRRSRGSAMRKSSSWTQLTPAPCQAQIEASLFSIASTSTDPKTLRIRLPSSSRLKSNTYPLICPLQSLRNGSTKSRSWVRRFLDLGRAKDPKWNASPQVTSFTDEGVEGNLFNVGRALAAKSLNEPRLRCTEFDENGNVTLVNGEYRKSELIAKVSEVGLCCESILD